MHPGWCGWRGVHRDQYREQHADNRSTGEQILVALSHEGVDTRSWKLVWSPQNPRRRKLEQRIRDHLKKYGIQPILARVKHSQMNGKLERFFGEYVKLRSAFHSFDEFITWYNDRPHGSLNFQSLETPERAFRRKMPLEAYFAIGHRLFGL